MKAMCPKKQIKEKSMKNQRYRSPQLVSAILLVLLLLPALTWPQQRGEVRILTLKECLDLALKNNPTISLNREKVQ